MDVQFSWLTLGMALAGFAVYFLASWNEFRRAKDTPDGVGVIAYIRLDAPAWLAALIGAVALYIAGPEIAPLIGWPATVTPGLALVAGYLGASAAPKLLGNIVARAGVR